MLFYPYPWMEWMGSHPALVPVDLVLSADFWFHPRILPSVQKATDAAKSVDGSIGRTDAFPILKGRMDKETAFFNPPEEKVLLYTHRGELPGKLLKDEDVMEGLKVIGAGTTTIALAGAIVRIGKIFSFALTKAIALFTLMMVFLILFVLQDSLPSVDFLPSWRAIPVRDSEQDSKQAYLCSLLLHQARKFKDNCSRPDHDISLMIWPGQPNHDIEGWDLFSKKKRDSISSSKPFLEDAVRLFELEDNNKSERRRSISLIDVNGPRNLSFAESS
nr:ATP synthase F0 subunit 9, mitochondrial [Tanacetum cinerariifolium]